MKWNERFAFGIESVDQQHEELFVLLSKVDELIQDAVAGVDCFDEFELVLRELESYTIYHFEEEEAMLKEIGYDKLEEHAIEHDNFVKKVHDTIEEGFDFEQSEVLESVLNFLTEWVSEHILVTDVQYVPLYRSKQS